MVGRSWWGPLVVFYSGAYGGVERWRGRTANVSVDCSKSSVRDRDVENWRQINGADESEGRCCSSLRPWHTGTAIEAVSCGASNRGMQNWLCQAFQLPESLCFIGTGTT
eukprot:1399774-Amphidinium_carterae.2